MGDALHLIAFVDGAGVVVIQLKLRTSDASHSLVTDLRSITEDPVRAHLVIGLMEHRICGLITAIDGALHAIINLGDVGRDAALLQVARNGKTGETYNVGSSDELTNLDVARRVCEALDELEPRSDGASHGDRITLVDDRPGHDFRYALDASRIANDLGWQPRHSLDEALHETVRWYIENETWCTNIMDGNYRGERLGLAHGLAGGN